MFDDGNRMPEMLGKCQAFLHDRLEALRDNHPDPSPAAIAECTRVAVQDFWLLHAGERAGHVGSIAEEPNTREEG